MSEAAKLSSSTGLRATTYLTLIGLLSATGIRPGEALALDVGDVDLQNGILAIRESKFGKSRFVPVADSTRTALARYAKQRDKLCPRPTTKAFLVSERGKRVPGGVARRTFAGMSCSIGLRAPAGSRRIGRGPRLQDFRHSFATRRLIEWYRAGLDVGLDQLRTPPGYGTVIFTAIRDCSENVMKREDGRKALILLTDGVDHLDRTSIETAIEHAQGADCILYPIRIFDAWPLATPLGIAVWKARLAKARKGLERMALETGGEEFEVSKDSTIQDIYTGIEEALRNQYSIGYVPDPVAHTGRYHKVKLSTKDPHLVVRSRAGYYAK